MYEDKPALRERFLRLRSNFDRAEWAGRSARICAHLEGELARLKGEVVLVYLPFRREPDLRPLLGAHWLWAVPRVIEQRMIWHRYESERVVRGAMGLLEPDPACEVVDPAQACFALVPAVACDHRGYRLGYGGGYFDRFFSNYALPAIAVTYRECVVAHLPIDPWDRPLAGWVTEEGLKWRS